MTTSISQPTALYTAMENALSKYDSIYNSNAANVIKDIAQDDTSAENAKPISEFLSSHHSSNSKSTNAGIFFEKSMHVLEQTLNPNSRKNHISLNNQESSSEYEQLTFDYTEGLHLLKHGASKKDKKAGKTLLLQTADLGHAKAAADCALFFHHAENGFPRDNIQAYKYAKKAAEQGSNRTYTLLGYCYQRGLGIEKNLINAQKYLTMATNNNSQNDSIMSMAQLYLCNLYVENDEFFFPVVKDSFQGHIKAIIDNKNKLTQSGFAFFLNIQSKRYLRGIGVDKNIEKGLQLGAVALGHDVLLPRIETKQLHELMKKHGIPSSAFGQLILPTVPSITAIFNDPS